MTSAQFKPAVITAKLLSRKLIVIGCMLAAGCSKGETVVNEARVQPMLAAVMHSKPDEVGRLAEEGVGLNERDPATEATPMIVAAETLQWRMAEVLLDRGADIWAHDAFGMTAAQIAETSRVIPGTEEDQARLRVIAKLKARGYPFPPPNSDEVLQMAKEGRWPPKGVRS